MSQEIMEDFEEIKMPLKEDETFEKIDVPEKGCFAGGRRSSSVEAMDSFEQIDIQDEKDEVEIIRQKVILKKTDSFEKVELPQQQEDCFVELEIPAEEKSKNPAEAFEVVEGLEINGPGLPHSDSETSIDRQLEHEKWNQQYLERVGVNEELMEQITQLGVGYICHSSIDSVVEEWIREKFDSAEGKTKDLLELFQEIGFSFEGAKRFKKFINSSMPHMTLWNWLDLYLDTMFYEPMFNVGITFPIMPELNNCLFKYNLTFSYYNCPSKTIDVIRLTSEEDEKFWIEKQKREALENIEEDCETWYHGTNAESAYDISLCGIQLQRSKGRKDFSDENGFYLQDNLEDALRYAREVRGDRQNCPDVSAVLIYNVPRMYLMSKPDKNVIFEFDKNVESHRKEEYKATVRYFRFGSKSKSSSNPRPNCLPGEDDTLPQKIDFIKGPIAENFNTVRDGKQRMPEDLDFVISDKIQLCIKTPAAVSLFDKHLSGIMLFQAPNPVEKIF